MIFKKKIHKFYINILRFFNRIPFYQPTYMKKSFFLVKNKNLRKSELRAQKIIESLNPSGRFAGQFYGERDSWMGRSGMNFHTRSDVERLFSDFDIEFFEEEEDDSETPRGETKHWHVFHVVARLQAS